MKKTIYEILSME